MTLVHQATGEVVTLAGCEQVIERGMATFVEVGDALGAIREARLYQEHFDTFEDYCKERWGFTRQRAHQMIDAAATVELVSTDVDTPPPANEAQARALTPLKGKPEAQREAWNAANDAAKAEGKKVTSEHVKTEVEKRTTETLPTGNTDEPSAAQQAADGFADRHPDHEYRVNANAARSKARHLLDLDPDRIAQSAHPESRDTWSRFLADMRAFADQLEGALAPGLKAVK